jgi:hypothetical protein
VDLYQKNEGSRLIPFFSRSILMACGTLALLVATTCHSIKPGTPGEIQIGQTRDEVIAVVGDPDEITTFTIPDEPFFGPQESLTNLLEAGTLVEEWRYAFTKEVTYVWFATKSSEPREEWKVIDTATVPADAVY